MPIDGRAGGAGDGPGIMDGAGIVDGGGRRAAAGPATIPLALRRMDVPADARQLVDVRKALEGWAHGTGVPPPVVEDIVLAVYEAMANAAEHAYRSRGGTFDLIATCDDGEVVVEVRDRGDWRPPPADPGARGRGLLMIRSTSRAEIETGPGGTTVRMRWSRPDGDGRPVRRGS